MPRRNSLAALLRAADAALRALLRPLLARLRAFLLRPRVPLPGARLAALGVITASGLRLLAGGTPGVAVPFPTGGTTPVPPLARLLRAVVRAAVGLVRPDEASKEAGWQAAQRWRDPAGRVLSQRLWRNAQLLRRRIDRMIADGLKAGTAPDALATAVETLLLGEAGKGDGRGALRRLIDTEARRAAGLAAVQQAEEDGTLLRWQTHASHPRPDECTVNAHRDSGFGPGVYQPADLPPWPAHPHCRCVITPVFNAR